MVEHVLYGICVLQCKNFFQSWVIGFLLLRARFAEVLRIWTQLKNHIVREVQASKSKVAILKPLAGV